MYGTRTQRNELHPLDGIATASASWESALVVKYLLAYIAVATKQFTAEGTWRKMKKY